MLRTQTDHVFLARAVELAQRGLGRVHPNPVVGAVVARDGDVLGEGWHADFGGPHAEVQAIADCADADLAGATIYVSLEPCCHHGKTPPCTDAILGAGIRRVVVASDDPTEKAAGRGPRHPARRGRGGRRRRRGARRPGAAAQPGPSASTRARAARGCCSSRR
jgi:diaminohydroxyphosphoribosylaminopyrimidine deaminase/5-amino-6-(5-phosphoribosylamino)uracil reductase